MFVTASVKDKEGEHQIEFSIENTASDTEILDKAFELGMNEYGYFDSVEIVSTEEEEE